MSGTPAAPVLAIERLDIEPAAEPGRELLIEGFSLTIAAGETVGLVGETGAGKSLSMRAGVGLLPAGITAVRGSVRFGGTETAAADAAALRAHLGHGICLLPQNGRGSLNPFLRVGAQIERVLGYQGVPRRERARQAAALLEAVDLPASDFLRRYPHQVSGGQAQRIAMVLALATNPRMLIADEPTTALDVTVQKQILELLADLRKRFGLTMLFISHDLAVVSQVADHVAVMRHGEIVEEGSCADIFRAAKHPYTRALLGAVPTMTTDLDKPLAVLN